MHYVMYISDDPTLFDQNTASMLAVLDLYLLLCPLITGAVTMMLSSFPARLKYKLSVTTVVFLQDLTSLLL